MERLAGCWLEARTALTKPWHSAAPQPSAAPCASPPSARPVLCGGCCLQTTPPPCSQPRVTRPNQKQTETRLKRPSSAPQPKPRRRSGREVGSPQSTGPSRSRSRPGAALAGEWLVAPEGRLCARQHPRTAHMGCSLQPGVNRTAATAIVPSLPLVISPLRRWGDHFQAYGAIPGTVERRQILHDKLPPGAGQHSLPALHRYHTHCFAKGVPAIPGRVSSIPPYSREVGICSGPLGCGAMWRERFPISACPPFQGWRRASLPQHPHSAAQASQLPTP